MPKKKQNSEKFYEEIIQEKLEKLRLYEARLWTYSGVASSKAIAPYVKTVRMGMPESGEDSFVISDDVWKADVFQLLQTSSLSQTELHQSLLETTEKLRTVTESDLGLVYLVDSVQNELFRLIDVNGKVELEEHWKVGPDSILAAYAAHSKEYILTDNVYGNVKYPKALDLNDVFIHSALTVPVMSKDKEVKVVLEFARSNKKDVYTKDDVDVIMAVTASMGQAIYENEQCLAKLKRTSIIKHVVDTVARHTPSYETALAEIMLLVRFIMDAEKVAFFITHVEGEFIYMDFYEETVKNKIIAIQRRVKLPEEDVVIRRTVNEKQVVNIKDKKQELPKNNIKYSGPPITASLCLPIIRYGEVAGVLQLINKNDGAYFNERDELMVQNFSVYLEFALNLVLMDRSVETINSELAISQELLDYHFEPCDHDKEEILKELGDPPDNLMTYAWFPKAEDLDNLGQLTLLMFEQTLGTLFMQNNNMTRFVLIVKKSYRHLPFHNYQHALISTNMMGNVIQRNKQIFTHLEKIALMIASICHDVDHRGYTNEYFKKVDHSLFRAYEDSYLENHHFDLTKVIMEHCKMCKYLSEEDYDKLLTDIKACIISTDLDKFDTNRAKLIEKLKDKTFSWTDDECRNLIKSLLMVASDISYMTKPYFVVKSISEALYEELHNQGDLEKKMGVVPAPELNRDLKDKIAEYEVNFLNSVALPCFHLISQLVPNTTELFESCSFNREQWMEVLRSKNEDVWFPDESFLEQFSYKIDS